MYIDTLGNGSHELHGIYMMLRRVLNSLVAQFKTGIRDDITLTIHDKMYVTFSYPCTEIEDIETIESLSCSFEIKVENGRTQLTFTPDETIFEGFSFRENIVSNILKSYCYVNKGLKVIYNDTIISAPNGLTDLLNNELIDDRHCPVIHLSGLGIEIAFTNKTKYAETSYHSFVNGIKTESGTHVDALKDALVKVIGHIFWDVDICPSQILEGLSAAISIDIVNPVYGQANPHSLASSKVSPDGPEIHNFVYDFLSKELPLYFKKNPETQWQLMNHFSEIAIWM